MDWLDSKPRNTVNSKNKSRVDFVDVETEGDK